MTTNRNNRTKESTPGEGTAGSPSPEEDTGSPARKNRRHGSWSSDKHLRPKKPAAANVEAAAGDDAGDDSHDDEEESDGPPRLLRQRRDYSPGADASTNGPKPKPKAQLGSNAAAGSSSRAPRAAAWLSAYAFLTLCAALGGIEYLCVYQNQCGTVPPNPAATNEIRIAALLLSTILVFVPAVYVAAETARVGVTSNIAAGWIVARQIAIALVIGAFGLLIGIGSVYRAWDPTMTARGRAQFTAEVVNPKFEAMSKFDRSFYETEEELASETIKLFRDAMGFAIAIAMLLGYASLTTLSSALHLCGGGRDEAGLGAGKGQGSRAAQDQEHAHEHEQLLQQRRRVEREERQREPLLDREQD